MKKNANNFSETGHNEFLEAVGPRRPPRKPPRRPGQPYSPSKPKSTANKSTKSRGSSKPPKK